MSYKLTFKKGVTNMERAIRGESRKVANPLEDRLLKGARRIKRTRVNGRAIVSEVDGGSMTNFLRKRLLDRMAK
jgi:hypothetical protein